MSTRTGRRVGLVVAVAVLLAAPTLALAQKDAASFGEGLGVTVTRPGQPAESAAPITVAPAGRAEESHALQKLRAQVAAAIGFLLRWGGGPSTAPPGALEPATPVLTGAHAGTVQTTALQPPWSGLGLERAPDGSVRAVTVRDLTVKPTDRPAVRGSARLLLDGPKVVKVEITPAP
jgi:hypothetical protein